MHKIRKYAWKTLSYSNQSRKQSRKKYEIMKIYIEVFDSYERCIVNIISIIGILGHCDVQRKGTSNSKCM